MAKRNTGPARKRNIKTKKTAKRLAIKKVMLQEKEDRRKTKKTKKGQK